MGVSEVEHFGQELDVGLGVGAPRGKRVPCFSSVGICGVPGPDIGKERSLTPVSTLPPGCHTWGYTVSSLSAWGWGRKELHSELRSWGPLVKEEKVWGWELLATRRMPCAHVAPVQPWLLAGRAEDWS